MSRTRAIDEKVLKEKDLGALYEDAIIQATRRSVHEVFEGDYAAHCQVVVFNGVVVGLDRAPGRDFRPCIVSLQAEREAFLDMDLRRVEPRACFRSLRGLSGASIAPMEPIRPIRTFDKQDARLSKPSPSSTALKRIEIS
jgi:restriction system protein